MTYIPLHSEIALHRLDEHEPEEHATCDPDASWWNQVEDAMKADQDADDQWCREVELQMITAHCDEPACNASEPGIVVRGSKREHVSLQCTVGLKRPKRPG